MFSKNRTILILSCSFSLWWCFVGDFRVSPNFLVVLGLELWLRLGLGCDKNLSTANHKVRFVYSIACLDDANPEKLLGSSKPLFVPSL